MISLAGEPSVRFFILLFFADIFFPSIAIFQKAKLLYKTVIGNTMNNPLIICFFFFNKDTSGNKFRRYLQITCLYCNYVIILLLYDYLTLCCCAALHNNLDRNFSLFLCCDNTLCIDPDNLFPANYFISLHLIAGCFYLNNNTFFLSTLDR